MSLMFDQNDFLIFIFVFVDNKNARKASEQKKLNFEECPIVDELKIPQSLVQITVGEDEIQRRIKSFVDLKREEINQNNLRDFIEAGSDDLCARVSSNVYRVKDLKGHLKIRRIINEVGPIVKSEEIPHHNPNFSGVSERLQCIEDSLQVPTNSTPKDIYQRLKNLEDQLAYLKTVSPEYLKFKTRIDASKAKKTVYTISDLDSIISSMESK